MECLKRLYIYVIKTACLTNTPDQRFLNISNMVKWQAIFECGWCACLKWLYTFKCSKMDPKRLRATAWCTVTKERRIDLLLRPLRILMIALCSDILTYQRSLEWWWWWWSEDQHNRIYTIVMFYWFVFRPFFFSNDIIIWITFHQSVYQQTVSRFVMQIQHQSRWKTPNCVHCLGYSSETFVFRPLLFAILGHKNLLIPLLVKWNDKSNPEKKKGGGVHFGVLWY